VIGKEGCQFDAYRPMVNYLSEDQRSKDDTFVYRQYAEPLPSLELILQGQFVASERRLVCEVSF
jgi:hypothetical protein